MNISDKNITSTRIAFPWQWHAERLQDDVITFRAKTRRHRTFDGSLCHGCEGFSDENSICNLASIQKPWARPFHVFTLIEQKSINQHRKLSLEAPTSWIVKKVNEEFAQHELEGFCREDWNDAMVSNYIARDSVTDDRTSHDVMLYVVPLIEKRTRDEDVKQQQVFESVETACNRNYRGPRFNCHATKNEDG